MGICIVCGKDSAEGRRYCAPCYQNRRRDLHGGKIPRYTYGESKCKTCGKKIVLWQKDNLGMCQRCSTQSTNSRREAHKTNRSYIARKKFKEFLGRPLTYNEVVHHIDEDIENNSDENLMLLSRRVHGSLHAFLRKRRALFERLERGNDETCWSLLRAELTSVYLEMGGAKFLRINRVGQSAPEPL